MSKTVRIGSAAGFLGDSATAAPQLIGKGELDYLVLDYLAEVTMSILTAAKSKNPDAGYAHDFTEWVWKENLREIAQKGVKIITNAGGVNPHGCRARMEELAKEAGVSLRIAVIEGDDLMDRVEEFSAQGVTEMYSGAPFPPVDRIASANAYLGGRPIAAALSAGADVVITGRVVDSALALGALMHEFGWADDEYDRLAAGSLAGHIIECGAQCCGGLFTDWELVEDWAHIGYPFVDVSADGSFVVSKPEGTGGLVTVGTVSEQVVYEIGDPQAYLLPDVACDFSELSIEQVGPDRVRVSNCRGLPPTSTYKVCATYRDGYRSIAVHPIVGMDAEKKAKTQASAMLERIEEMMRDRNFGPFRRTHVETLGAEASYGSHARTRNTREVITKIAVEHEDKAALNVFAREINAPMTSMLVGNTGWFAGRSNISPIIRLFSFPVEKSEIEVAYNLDGMSHPVDVSIVGGFDEGLVQRPNVKDPPDEREETVTVRLVEVAWARSGDKGDTFNVGVIARDPAYLPHIRKALTPEAVRDWFAHEFRGAVNPRVERFDLPGMNAINFLCHEGLGGGGMATMRLDPLAKGKAQQLLEYQLEIPIGLAQQTGLAA